MMSTSARAPRTAASDRMAVVGVVGTRLNVHYRPGPGTPLVLCNGIGVGFDVLDPSVAALDPNRPVLRFDAPGAGGSPSTRVPYTIPGLAHSVTRALDELGIDTFDALGLSWGGAVAQQLALRHPRRCRRLVLVATATGAVMVPAAPNVLTKMLTPRRFDDRDYAAAVAGSLYGGHMRGGWRTVLTAPMHECAPRRSRTAYLQQLLAGALWTSILALPLIRQPTLVISGGDDQIVPAVNATIMRTLLPRATVHRHSGGHLDLITRPDVLAPIVDRFLDRAC
ncbi:alpha/beta fold hydrolase [Tsukamurella soli]|uniref:Poly(3-hydroxyalkanoate) depolymerase n=1 Tax=Tsukamurella soli TaxID=644556 RepID=A0ABP8KBB8_9ACTN